jgi:hypothetical protein
VLVAVLLLAPVAWLAIDESAVPPTSDMPSLPVGVAVAHNEVLCGSGGCWRELALTGPAHQSRAETAANLDLSHETCSARNLLDRREVCNWVDVVDKRVRLYLQFHRPFQ